MGKRFTLTFDDNIVDNLTGITHNVHSGYDVAMDLIGLLNILHEENIQLKSEINILKNTVGRNEAFIKQITSNGKWSNTSMK